MAAPPLRPLLSLFFLVPLLPSSLIGHPPWLRTEIDDTLRDVKIVRPKNTNTGPLLLLPLLSRPPFVSSILVHPPLGG